MSQRLFELCSEDYTESTYQDIKNIFNSKSKPNLEEQNDFGCTVLILAMRYSNRKVIKLLLDYGADINFVVPVYNWTALRMVLKYKDEKTVRMILDNENLHDEIFELPDSNGFRPIHHLICRENKELSSDILDIFINRGIDLESETDNGARPIHYACRNRSNQDICKLIDMKVNINVICDEEWHPLHFLCNRENTLESLKHIINKYPKTNLELKTQYGETILHHACKSGSNVMIEYLVGIGCDIEATNCEGWRPIHIACMSQTLDTIRFLLSKGVNVLAKTNKGVKPKRLLAFYKFMNDDALDVIKIMNDTEKKTKTNQIKTNQNEPK
jgi:ankyrin repeat protein